MYGEPLSWWQRKMQRFQPTAIELASAELKDAELAVLQCHSQAEYAALRHQIYNLEREYHEGRVKRLRGFLESQEHMQPIPLSEARIQEILSKPPSYEFVSE